MRRLVYIIGAAAHVVFAAPEARAQIFPNQQDPCPLQRAADPTGEYDASYAGGLSVRAGGLTPATAPGATTVSPREAMCLMEAEESLLVVAAMSDESGIQDSYPMPIGGAGGSFDDAVQARYIAELDRLTGNDRNRPILIYCHHIRCFLSYNAALRAAHAGYRRIYWMREGLAGWRTAGFGTGFVRGEYGQSRFGSEEISRDRQPGLQAGYPFAPGRRAEGSAMPDIQRICGQLPSGSTEPEGSVNAYAYQTSFYRTVGVTDSDPALQTRRKVRAWWKAHGAPQCDTANHGVVSLLKVGMAHQFDSFVFEAVQDWRLPLNDLDVSDGRTPLDFAADLYDRNRDGALAQKYLLYYRFLRAHGARHRLELERSGDLADPRDLQATFLPAHEAAAAQGETDSLFYLMGAYFNGYHTAENRSLGLQHLRAYEDKILRERDYPAMVHVGYEYWNEFSKGPKDDRLGADWFRRAAEGGSGEGALALGKALRVSKGVERDQQEALRWFETAFSSDDDVSQIAAVQIGMIQLGLGRRDEALKWLRYAVQTGGMYLETDGGRPLYLWFDEGGISRCGVNIRGFDNCLPSATSP